MWRRDYANKHYHLVWYTQFDDHSLKNIKVIERTQFILAILDISRTITLKCFMTSGWLLDLAELFCQPTFSQSLMIIQWKVLKLWPPPTAECVPIIPPVLLNGRIKKESYHSLWWIYPLSPLCHKRWANI